MFSQVFCNQLYFFKIHFLLRIEVSISQAREELRHRKVKYRQSDGCGSCSSGGGIWEQVWGATQTWKLLECSSSHGTSETDLFCLEHYLCLAAERDRQQETPWEGVSGVCVGASPAAGGWDGKEGLSKPCLCNHLAEDRCCSST